MVSNWTVNKSGDKRGCEELVNEHEREKIKRYKIMTDRGQGSG
jgi:hypothetical protein